MQMRIDVINQAITAWHFSINSHVQLETKQYYTASTQLTKILSEKNDYKRCVFLGEIMM
jgi:hypothetical protein